MGWLSRLLGKRDDAIRAKTPILASVTIPDRDEAPMVYGDQPVRKQWAESVLYAQGVPINPQLPMIESEAQITLRTPREIADRLRAVSIIAARGSGLPLADARRFIDERGIDPHLTPAERAFLDTPEPTMRDQIQFSWRHEAAWVLLWALRHVEGQLGAPRETCDVDAMTDIIINVPDLGRDGVRSANDILNEADLVYRYHWAIRQAGIDGQAAPADLDPGVVLERHYALNWLIGYGGNADWDDVTTDT